MDEQKNIRIISTHKTDTAVLNLLKKYNLEESDDQMLKKILEKNKPNINIFKKLLKDVAARRISEKDLVNSLQSSLKISQQTAGQISKEAMVNIIPFLEKIPEDRLRDSAFMKELDKRISGVAGEPVKIPEEEKGEEIGPDMLPKITPPVNISSTTKKINRDIPPIKKTSINENIQESAPKPVKSRGKDNYREPIE